MWFLAKLSQVIIVAHCQMHLKLINLIKGGSYAEEALGLHKLGLDFEKADQKQKDLRYIILRDTSILQGALLKLVNVLSNNVSSVRGRIGIKIEVLFIASLQDLLEKSSCISARIFSFFRSLRTRLCCLSFLEINLVDVCREDTNDALTQYCVRFQGLEKAQDRVVIVALPQ